MSKLSAQSIFLWATVLGSALLLAGLVVVYENKGLADSPAATVSKWKLEQIPIDGARAYEHLKQLCGRASDARWITVSMYSPVVSVVPHQARRRVHGNKNTKI